MNKESKFFPLFIDIKNKKILVVGGGTIATRRVKTLLNFGASIEVVSPHVTEELRKLENKKYIRVEYRKFISKDIDGCILVVAATNDRETNHLIGEEAKKQSIFTSVADCKEESTFYFPAIFEDERIIGGLVSKGGNDHKRVRKTAEELRAFLNKEEI